MEGAIFHAFFLIFCGAAAIASLALYTRQPLLVAYIAIGILLGPHGFKVMSDVDQITEMSHIGIIFLLFLLGLDMQPRALVSVLQKATSIALISSAVFGAAGFFIWSADRFFTDGKCRYWNGLSFLQHNYRY